MPDQKSRDKEGRSTGMVVEALTRREREILALLAQGHSAPEIAENLTLAVSSVKWHIQHLYGKLGVNSKRQALKRAQELGLLETVPLVAAAEGQPSAWPERKHNLPLQVTHFFGREREIAQLKERLTEQRLVTLTGSGGVGKTRLSLRTAEEVRGRFPDGVWFVELAALSDAALVHQHVAVTLGVRDNSGRPILDTLTFSLRDRQVLLVLDNCEHLLEACAWLADTLLRACPRLRILASSREPLGIAGEVVFSVPSLSFPDPDHLPPIDRLSDYMAVTLFIDRARLVVPDYQIAAHNAAPLARICRRLDGIPLAIEMAAARLNILTAEQLADRLDDVFRLLTGGSRSALPRQQTLRATIDWSYELLSEKERLLFQRLSIFTRGCRLEAAEDVCAAEFAPLKGRGARKKKNMSPAPPPPSSPAVFSSADVLDLLASLVAKSMVVADRRPGEETRYYMLELTRQYAREKLQATGDSERLHKRHRDYFLQFAETNGPKLSYKERPAWRRRFEADRENLRQALEWTVGDTTEVEFAIRLIVALWPFGGWTWHETNAWVQKGIDLCEGWAGIPPSLHARLLACWAWCVWGTDQETSRALAQQSLALSRSLGPEGRETLLINLQMLYWCVVNAPEDRDQAQAMLDEQETIIRGLAPGSTLDHRLYRALNAVQWAHLELNRARYESASIYALESIGLYKAWGNEWNLVWPYEILGEVSLHIGKYDQAGEYFLKALDLAVENGLPDQGNLLAGLCEMEIQRGNLEQAFEYCMDYIKLAYESGTPFNVLERIEMAAKIFARRARYLESARLSGAAEALSEKLGRKLSPDSSEVSFPGDWHTRFADVSIDSLVPDWRARPDGASIVQAWNEGRAMTYDEAVALALRDLAI